MSDTPTIDSIPMELFLKIFTYMTAKDLIKCRTVCCRWKGIIDGLTHSEYFWKKKCELEFASIIETARYKCRHVMDWSDLYRSLSLWSKLKEATEYHDEFCPATNVAEEIKSFNMLHNGLIGIHKRTSIVYYNIETLRPAKRKPILGEYSRYAENEHLICILSCHLQLYVIKKQVGSNHPALNVTYDDVKIFMVVEHCVFYVDMNDDLYFVLTNALQITRSFVAHCTEGVLTVGYKDGQLHVLTFQRKVYTLVSKKLVLVHLLGPTSNILHELKQYNLLELLDWRIYFQWMFVLNHNIPQGPLQDIITTKIYGDVVFIGSTWGVLRIYYQPFSLGEMDLFSAEPIKQYNFMERFDCPVLSMCPILHIDVFETENGHKVIVAMPKKIAILNFSHNYFKSCSSSFRYTDNPTPPGMKEKSNKLRIITI